MLLTAPPPESNQMRVVMSLDSSLPSLIKHPLLEKKQPLPQ